MRRAKLAAWMRKKSPEPYALMVEAYAAMGQKTQAEQAYNKASQLQYRDMQKLRNIIGEIGKEQAKEGADSKEEAAEEAAEEAGEAAPAKQERAIENA